jgi:hypothetical protein
VIERRYAQKNRRLQAPHSFVDAADRGPMLKQNIGCAHSKRREHISDRVGEVEA